MNNSNNSKISEIDGFTGGRDLVNILNNRNYNDFIQGNGDQKKIVHILDYKNLDFKEEHISKDITGSSKTNLISARKRQHNFMEKQEKYRRICKNPKAPVHRINSSVQEEVINVMEGVDYDSQGILDLSKKYETIADYKKKLLWEKKRWIIDIIVFPVRDNVTAILQSTIFFEPDDMNQVYLNTVKAHKEGKYYTDDAVDIEVKKTVVIHGNRENGWNVLGEKINETADIKYFPKKDNN
ncbi:MAG: hypothetical protein GY828_03165 [Candidatus Gracilibacteria bacterium]|nr:hypothetical protein [Candidatus Gracilibacteria bacterium]